MYNFRFEDPEADNNNYENQIRESDIQNYCKYCPYYNEEADLQDIYRQPQYNPPPGQHQGPPQGPPPGQHQGPSHGQHQGPPSGPPPTHTPSQHQAQFHAGPGAMAVDPGSIRPCLFRYVYIWPRRGRGYWAWLTNVGRRSVSGFKWNGRRWVYFGIDLRSIESFICY